MTQHTRRSKSKMLERNPPHKRAGFRLQQRDRVTIEEVYKKRILNTHQIVDLVSAKTQSGRRNIEQRLRPMFDHGFLNRPKHQDRLLYEYNQPILYTIGPKSGSILRGMGYPASDVKMQLRGDLKADTLEHHFGVATIHTYLDLGIPSTGWQLTEWLLERNSLRRTFSHKGVNRKVIPDGVAFFEKDMSGDRQALFVEFDNNDNVPVKRMVERYESYWLMRELRLHQEIPFCIASPAFRVATVVAIPPRVEPDDVKRAQKERNRLERLIEGIHQSEIIQPGGYRVFWFVMGHQFLGFEYRSVAERILKTPKDTMMSLF